MTAGNRKGRNVIFPCTLGNQTVKAAVRYGQLAQFIVAVRRVTGCTDVAIEHAAADGRLIPVQYAVILVGRLDECTVGNGQSSVVIILDCDFAAGERTAVDGQFSKNLVCVSVRARPAIDNQTGKQAVVLVGKTEVAVFDRHGSGVVKHIPAIAAAGVCIGTGFGTAGKRAVFDGKRTGRRVIQRRLAVGHIVHRALAGNGQIALIPDGMAVDVCQRLAVQVKRDRLASRDGDVFVHIGKQRDFIAALCIRNGQRQIAVIYFTLLSHRLQWRIDSCIRSRGNKNCLSIDIQLGRALDGIHGNQRFVMDRIPCRKFAVRETNAIFDGLQFIWFIRYALNINDILLVPSGCFCNNFIVLKRHHRAGTVLIDGDRCITVASVRVTGVAVGSNQNRVSDFRMDRAPDIDSCQAFQLGTIDLYGYILILGREIQGIVIAG